MRLAEPVLLPEERDLLGVAGARALGHQVEPVRDRAPVALLDGGPVAGPVAVAAHRSPVSRIAAAADTAVTTTPSVMCVDDASAIP